MADDRERYVEAGIEDCLPKPLNRAALLAALHHWLEPKFAVRMAAQQLSRGVPLRDQPALGVTRNLSPVACWL